MLNNSQALMNVAGDMWGETNSNRHIYEVGPVFSFQGDVQLTCIIQNACEESMYFVFFFFCPRGPHSEDLLSDEVPSVGRKQ